MSLHSKKLSNSAFRVRCSITEPPNDPTNTIKKKVHINVLLEDMPHNIVGFVQLKEQEHTLCDIRSCIKSQFDPDQLQLLGGGDSFKFIMDSAPISRKQEQSIPFKDIVLSEHAAKLLHQTGVFPPPLSDISDDHTYQDILCPDLAPHVSRSAPNSRHNSCDIQYEKLPHHYQYMNSSNPSPVYHLVVPSTPDTRRIYDAKRERTRQKRIAKQRATQQSGLVSPLRLSPRFAKRKKSKSRSKSNRRKSSCYMIHKNDDDTVYYSIVVRNATKVTKTDSFRTLTLITSELENPNASVSIFSRQNHTQEMESEMDAIDRDTESEISGSETTMDGYLENDYYLKQTRLEQTFGGKLPTIRTSKSKKHIEPSDQIENILANALVDDQFKLKPMKHQRKTVAYPILPTRPLNKHMYMHGKEHPLVPLIEVDDVPDTGLLRDDTCRFTVVGSPIHGHKQRMWMFYDPSELILGLQGVHHSEEHPVWMDLVCDEDTFVMISEHVRPSIHQLTIEDCISPECREKLEMFDSYLFVCIHTSVAEKLCMIVFKGMIITYHTESVEIDELKTSDVTDVVLTEARNRLDKRHKSQCPSPGWVVHTIIDVIVDRMIPEVECRVQEVQNVENLVFALSGSSHDELLQRLQIARNWLMVYRSRLWPKSTMTHNFINADWRRFLGGVQGNFWNDINDHVARMVDLLSIGEQTLESCQNIFVAKISLDMADQSNQLGDGASRLTAVGSIFLPLSFLSAVWGMNCKVPFQYEGPNPVAEMFSDDYYGFMIIFAFMIVIAYVTYKYHISFT